MTHIVKQQEPETFNEKVRIPGRNFLKTYPFPNSRQLQEHNYWKNIKDDLSQLYKHICAYTGEWVYKESASVDHFMPKSKYPQLAYEWDNYRLTTKEMNNIKGDKVDLIDPFDVQIGWFVLVLPGCDIKPCETLNEIDRNKINYTINVLKLNSDKRSENRSIIIQDYINNGCPFDSLKKRYPYIACELERRDLQTKVADYFKPLK
jgi:hypothetical protein